MTHESALPRGPSLHLDINFAVIINNKLAQKPCIANGKLLSNPKFHKYCTTTILGLENVHNQGNGNLK